MSQNKKRLSNIGRFLYSNNREIYMSKIRNWFDRKEYIEISPQDMAQYVGLNGLHVSEMITFKDYEGRGIGYGIINNAYNVTRYNDNYGSLFESVYGFCSTDWTEDEYDETEYEE